MSAYLVVNAVMSLLVVAAIAWAVHSRHVCDGIAIKISLGALAIGLAANASHPTPHSALWIVCSLGALVLSIAWRVYFAHLKKEKVTFFVY